MPLSRFEPLLGLDGLHFFSLQMGAAASQLSAINAPITDLRYAIKDLADTAALMAHLDVIITVDTAVAHLAGALGKQTWVVLPSAPDWRWLADREDSPWYPTVRLFRQTCFGDWDGPIARLGHALSALVK
jgi:ADP-heptose:LPS heptosyltransferase